MLFLRHKQRAISAVSPHIGNRRAMIPSRGIGGPLKNDHFLFGGTHWTITGNGAIKDATAVLGDTSTISQAVTGISDAEKIIITLDVISITGLVGFSYAGVAGADITATGVQDISVTAGTTNVVLITAGVGEAITLGRIVARHQV